MKQTFTHSCGHEATYDIEGNRPEMMQKVLSMKEQPCPCCINNDLPQLAGSDKQIKWATDIRANILNNMYTVEKMIAKANTDNDPRLDIYTQALDCIKSQSQASWWIDNRNTSAQMLHYYTSMTIAKAKSGNN
jgi:hypothetical protein